MDDLRFALQRYSFYHVIPLGGTLQTPGWDHPEIRRTQEMTLHALGQLDLKERRVLDVGCRDGLLSFAAERQGADEVIGIDNDVSRGAVELLIPHLGSQVQMVELNVHDLTPETFGLFDVVVCAGVLYHLRYPFWGLKRLRDVLRPGGVLLLETAVLADGSDDPLLFCPVGPESPFEPTSCSFFNRKGLEDTLRSLGFTIGSVAHLYDYEQHLRRPWVRCKRRLQALFGRRERRWIDRAVFVCPVAADPANVDRPTLDYWEGTHRMHTKDQRNKAKTEKEVQDSPPGPSKE
jgi:SAM-dependent methyltransferase